MGCTKGDTQISSSNKRFGDVGMVVIGVSSVTPRFSAHNQQISFLKSSTNLWCSHQVKLPQLVGKNPLSSIILL